MKVTFKDEKRKRTLHKTLRPAIEFFQSEIAVPNLKVVEVTIKYNGASWHHGGSDYNSKKETGLITLNGNLSEVPMIVTLAHEMVHLKQWSSGALDFVDKQWIWKGKLYPFVTDGSTEYLKQPWEKEAWLSQTKLSTKYLVKVVKDLG